MSLTFTLFLTEGDATSSSFANNLSVVANAPWGLESAGQSTRRPSVNS